MSAGLTWLLAIVGVCAVALVVAILASRDDR